ncbi:MAG: hypothetical protein WBW71_01255 [Bacteroidota bacterium]
MAQLSPYELGGYMEYLYGSVDVPPIGRTDENLIHARINSRFFPTEGLTLAADLRNRIYFGGIVEKTPDFLSTIKSQHDFGDAGIVWWNTNSSVGYSQLDRAWLDENYGKFDVTIGRQRIAWGTNLVWNPTDLFNPMSSLDFDYEERPGADVARFQYFSSEVSKVEVAVKPGDTRDHTVIAGKILLNQWNYDFHFLGGERGYQPLFGFAWAGNIAGAGFQGELLTAKPSDEAVVLFPFLQDKWTTSAALSFDYTFPSTLYLHTEGLYNDRGVTHNASTAQLFATTLNLLTPARWSLFQEISYDVHPLVQLSGFLIFNPNDRSIALVPSVSWSALTNVDLMAIGLLFNGAPLTEYGSYGKSIFVRGKFSF